MKSVDFRTNSMRGNQYKLFFLWALAYFAGYGRTTLEVFTRRNFGRRYLSVANVVTVAVIIAIYPLRAIIMDKYGSNLSQEHSWTDFFLWLFHYATWYIFLVLVVIRAIHHDKQIVREDGVFDFNHYSKSTGELHPLLYTIKLGKLRQTTRNVECYIEPLVFFTCGLGLFILGQYVGLLIMIFSVMYSASYYLQYWSGDEMILNLIDQIIANDNMESIFIDGAEPVNGYQWRTMRPKNADIGRKALDYLKGQSIPTFEAF